MSEMDSVNFSKEVRAAFDNLLKGYGFVCVSATPLKVRYESEKVFIIINYGLYDCEVAINFGRLWKEEQYSFTLFLRLVNPTLEKQMGDRIAYELHKVQTDLAALARALEREGQAILRGDDSTFEQMKSVTWWQFMPEVLGGSDEKN